MTLRQELVEVLKTVSPRVFAGFAPTNTQRPYITFQRIGGQVIRSLENVLPQKENAEVQIDVWADSSSAADDLIHDVEAALIVASTMTARPVAASVSDYDADMERFCSRQDFTIWCDR